MCLEGDRQSVLYSYYRSLHLSLHALVAGSEFVRDVPFVRDGAFVSQGPGIYATRNL